MPHLQSGGLNATNELWEFKSPFFVKGQPDLLLLIVRKRNEPTGEQQPSANATNEPTNANPSTAPQKPSLDLSAIMAELQAIKAHQVSISSDLRMIQQDNMMLWRETIFNRERHQQHQATIDKILRFLASVYSVEGGPGASGASGVGRSPGDTHLAASQRARFLLEDVSPASEKSPRVRTPTAEEGENVINRVLDSSTAPSKNRFTPLSPKIDDDAFSFELGRLLRSATGTPSSNTAQTPAYFSERTNVAAPASTSDSSVAEAAKHQVMEVDQLEQKIKLQDQNLTQLANLLGLRPDEIPDFDPDAKFSGDMNLDDYLNVDSDGDNLLFNDNNTDNIDHGKSELNENTRFENIGSIEGTPTSTPRSQSPTTSNLDTATTSTSTSQQRKIDEQPKAQQSEEESIASRLRNTRKRLRTS